MMCENFGQCCRIITAVKWMGHGSTGRGPPIPSGPVSTISSSVQPELFGAVAPISSLGSHRNRLLGICRGSTANVRFRPIADISIRCEVRVVNTERQPFPWPLFVAVTIVALVVGYAIGASAAERASRRPNMEDWNGSRAQAEDAMRRWAPKGIGGHRSPEEMLALVRQNYTPQLMAYPTKNCIRLHPDSVGGAPIYCYRANSLDLLEEYSNVE